MFHFLTRLIREDNVLSLAGNMVIAVFGFSGFALLARSLDPNDFAQWVLFISGGSLMEMIRYGITNNGLVRFLSGHHEHSKEELIGSNVLISLLATLFIAILLLSVKFFFGSSIQNSGYALFFNWYPILAFINLPLNNALLVQQARMDYSKILVIRAINSILFFVFLLLSYFFFDFSIIIIVISFIILTQIFLDC